MPNRPGGWGGGRKMKFFGKGDKARMSAKSCDHQIYRCGHCGETGCQSRECNNRQFQEADLCRDCGRSWEMFPVSEAPTAAPVVATTAAPSASRIKPKPSINLPWTEIVLGTMLVVTVVGFGILAQNRDQVFARFDRGGPLAPSVTQTATVVSSDVCGCYDEGLRLSGNGIGVQSSEYKTGFLMCRELFGVDGGDAWTAGWNARRSSKAYEASCRSYRRK